MRKILKMRWLLFVVWIISLALSITYSPDLNKVLRSKGQQYLSSDTPSVKADNILKKMDKTSGNTDIIVFNSKNELSSSNMDSIEAGINNIKSDKSSLGISNLIDPFNIPSIKSKLISKDKKTLMVTFKLNKKGREVKDIKNEINSKLKNVKSNHYLTGTDFISDDYMRTVSTGVDKSALLTIFFILIVLIILFRSVITPLISLFAVGISYLVSYAIVGQLVYRFDYPISSLTQLVLVLILFGIGTDYNILLFNRFKEEMSHSDSIDEAIISTYKTAGKTIAFSILTVFVAFLSLTLAKFGLYRSANCVAIAVVVLLLEILTFTPIIMKILGTKLFWPSKKITNHGENKLWAKGAAFSVKKPILVSSIIILILIPIVCFNTQKFSYDTVNELGNSVDSVKGFNLITQNFGKGEALTTTVVIDNSKPMDNNNTLTVIDSLTNKLKNIKGVKSASSITQPLSDPIDSLYLGSQTKTVSDGLSKSKDGVDTINNGIGKINESLNSVNLNNLSKTDALVTGTGKVQNGLNAITSGLKQINSGISSGADGADKIAAGIAEAKSGMDTISKYTKQLSDNLAIIQKGYSDLGNAIPNVTELQQAVRQMNDLMVLLSKNYGFSNDKSFQGVEAFYNNINAGLSKLNSGLSIFKQNYTKLTFGLSEVTSNLNQINAKQNELSNGLTQLQNGSTALSDGLKKGAAGQNTVIENMAKLNSGLDQVKAGQTQLNSMLNKLGSSVPQLKDALNKSSNGLSQISNGLSKTNNYMQELNNSNDFFAPKETFSNASIKEALDMYMNKSRTITKLTIVLDADPYSAKAMDTTKEINDTIPGILKGTVLRNAKFGTSGTSASDYDLNKTATGDLNTMKVIVLASIFVILLIVIRSPLISFYISAALMAAYYISSSVLNFVVFNIFKLDGVSWNVPFFSFVMIVALGVDYSIFLMMRFKEYKDMDAKEAIVLASKHIGTVVMSAALILGGTFVTLVPAGVKLLTQLAIAVVVGLIALSIILLPLFLPALIALPAAIKNISKKKSNSYKEDISA
ncbi:X-X-X-Leu-X-X-Gly heptad repeat-containing protein [Clostridium sp. DMHC 10]|uniref:MMPL family transporter n=1 Tax=Clostridium sp. DMHC 10 TaxID=747377 RepID=UPI00069FFF81|nr:MMPL family transporter [Clostridium sp. DMHC 10]KOF56513.1 X-X-X-Leu-X-X-Gly heptad repeat-containing protein [Clostridium sp. DMHC 10]